MTVTSSGTNSLHLYFNCQQLTWLRFSDVGPNKMAAICEVLRTGSIDVLCFGDAQTLDCNAIHFITLTGQITVRHRERENTQI